MIDDLRLHLNNYSWGNLFLPVLFLTIACNGIKKNPTSIISMDFTIELDTVYSYTSQDTLRTDTSLSIGDDTYLLEVTTYSLNDSSLTYLSIDTIDKTIYQSLNISSDAYWIITLSKNGERQYTRYLKKKDTGIPTDYYVFSVSNPHLPELKYFNPTNNKMIFHLWMGVPETDWMDDYFMVMSINDGSIYFTGRHGMNSCISELQVLDDEFLLTCNGLYQIEQKQRIDKIDDPRPCVIAAEAIDPKTVLIMYDHLTFRDFRNGQFIEEEDTTIDNTIVFNTKGEKLYTFNYRDYCEPLSYSASLVRSKKDGRIIILDLTHQKVLILQPDKLEDRALIEAPDILPDSSEILKTWVAEVPYLLYITPSDEIYYSKVHD